METPGQLIKVEAPSTSKCEIKEEQIPLSDIPNLAEPTATDAHDSPSLPVKEEPDDGLSKNQRKKKEKLARRIARRKEKRVEEKERRKLRRKAARDAGRPLPTRKQLRVSGSMATSSSRQRVAVDCSFDALMSESCLHKMHQQLNYCYAANRRSTAPFQLHLSAFTGPSAEIYRQMQAPSGGDWDVHRREATVVEDFGAENVVYLTAESETTLTALDESKVYVIGGLVDHNAHKGLCHRLATEAGLATARLPIDDFLVLKSRKILTINHVYEILLEFSRSGDWQAAMLKIIPQRKDVSAKEVVEEEKPQLQKSSAESTDSAQMPSAEKQLPNDPSFPIINDINHDSNEALAPSKP